ncbi:MAG: hypothetical protein QOD98_4679, partial [Nocardioidaceae bacterium]|nr:hypothetical protein [Nocardioidaceae bacterium]
MLTVERSRARRRLASTLVTAVVLGVGLVAPVVSAAPAAAVSDSGITGTVTDTANAGMPDVTVSAAQYDPLADVWGEAASTSTDVDGNYVIGGLAAGTYRIGFFPSDAHLMEYWDDRPTFETATDVIVAAGATVTGKDATLVLSSDFTGTVTADAGATPLDGALVVAYRFDALLQDWVQAGSAFTDVTGSYDVSGLRADTYRVEFIPSGSAQIPEFWNNKPDLGSADGVVVGDEVTVPNIDAALAAGAHVTGTVTGPSGALVNAT